MGSYLIAAASDPTWLEWSFTIFKVAFGLGMVIFVHELGHFLVAKLCGVQCDKFYLGFDFFGWKLWKFQFGETEYGIGVFPLGGYVKMLGQEDNPARLREELERAKAAQHASATEPEPEDKDKPGDGPEEQKEPNTAAAKKTTGEGEPPAEEIDIAAVERALFDPRSYLAQSVPKRMAIISAGVVMNVIFAFFAAVLGYGLGVEQVACAVGEVVPGKAAWKANITTGDKILEIAGKPTDRFEDLMAGIALGDVSDGITMVIQAPDSEQPESVAVMPDQKGQRPTIGVGIPHSNRLVERLPAMPGSAAANAKPPLAPACRVTRVDDVAVRHYADVRRQLVRRFDRPVTLTLERDAGDARGEPSPSDDAGKPGGEAGAGPITVEIGPQPMKRLGLIMEMGPITAVQEDSPAEAADIRPGDLLRGIDGRAVGDPMTLDQRLRRLAGRVVRLKLIRDGTEIAKDVKLRQADWYTRPFTSGSPVEAAPLGVAYSVRNRVADVIDGSPAQQQGIATGDVVVQAKIVPPDKQTIRSEGLEEAAKLLRVKETTLEFDDEQLNWPFLLSWLQDTLPGARVDLKLRRNGEERTVSLTPVAARQWFNPLRGIFFQKETFPCKAGSLDEAVRLGFEETVDSLTMIWRTLQKLSTGQVSAKMLQGPVGIFGMAFQTAATSNGRFLVFLCLLSANLAVINFLPIPILDGGHMVFLAYEGIRGKPPSERVFYPLLYLGFFFIIALMIWVIGLDIGRFMGW